MDDVEDFLTRRDPDETPLATCLGCGRADCDCDEADDGTGAAVWCECGAPRDEAGRCVAGCQVLGGEG